MLVGYHRNVSTASSGSARRASEPSQPRTSRGQLGFSTFESVCGRETDSPLEEAGFELLVPGPF